MNIWDLATGALFGFVLGLLLSPNRSLAQVRRRADAAGETSVELADEQTLRIIAQMDAEYKAAMQKWGAN